MKTALIPLLLASSAASAGQLARKADWWMVGHQTEPHAIVFVDRSSITGGNIKRAWSEWVLRDKMPGGFEAEVSLNEYNCDARRFRRLARTYYLWDGSVDSRTWDKAEWQDMAPGSNIHVISVKVCNGVDPAKDFGPVPEPQRDSAVLFDILDRRERARRGDVPAKE